ncbi:hypothetical protein METBIDRAFT_47730 [Metschnikowia bicuspidata var. bicuspidata NRRL YB-4993]|uniref:Uncharacterized protein n=1 Tax=Metschnikowia bicuspidata var. bicuspidata NRRL YB-4993 TaxID=869754 RepID=A0A1A0H1V8_9ASCO|nr:hypothetical protein METBIDRAFT_47730 [Metschnikowia bicuspidata var. bicuspidata NRRL YB-4993]OBA18014.1 hypothetical protein METBIDRAFT_47730 [Metschnikowia bicuspidata var. bicuspidata NRRL YB-4993]
MAQIRKQNKQERISKSRAAKASALTGLTVAFFLAFCYHVWWAVNAFYHNKFGSNLSNFMIIVGGLALNAYLSVQFLLLCETKLLSNGIDADHKKYI